MRQQGERHAEAVALIHVAPEQVFARLDDQRQLAAHMTKASWMTLGSKFNFELDEFQGRRIGSIIRMNGRIAGIELGLDEIVNEYEPPLRKAWATLGDRACLSLEPIAWALTWQQKVRARACKSGLTTNCPAGRP